MTRYLLSCMCMLLVAFISSSRSEFVNFPASRFLQPTNAMKWSIKDPVASWSGYRLKLDYELSDAIDDDMIKVQVFRDGQCTREMNLPTDGLKKNLNPDDTPLGDGSGKRTVRLSFVIIPAEIQQSSFISVADNQSIVSFCLRVSLFDPRYPFEPANTWEENLSIAVVFANNTGIVGFLEDNTALWGVDVFRCNATNHRLNVPETISQGQKVRLCLTPNNETKTDGIYLHGISSFNYFRDDIVQEAVLQGQRIGDGDLTEVACKRGSNLCVIESRMRNAFFHSPGIIQSSGTMWLQFGTREARRLRVPFNSRSLYTSGEFVGEKPFNHTIDIEPSNQEFAAEVFRCNFLNEEVASDAILIGDNPARICMRPDEKARAAGVFMRRIESFTFRRDRSTQKAIEGGASSPGTLMLCSQGDETCSLKTDLDAAFFVQDGSVEGFGEAVLQFGPESEGRRTQVVSRRLQNETGNEEKDIDPGYAGTAPVVLGFKIAFSKEVRSDPANWWSSAPTYLKVLYLFGIIGAILLCCCCCCCGGLLYFCDKRRRKDMFNDIIPDQAQDRSVDAFIDSKASFYSDLDFATDASEESSDEESLSDHFDDNLEEKVAILFPSNPDPKDLSQPLGVEPGGPGVYNDAPSPALRSNSRPVRGQPDRLSDSEHVPRAPYPTGPPRGSMSRPPPGQGRGLSSSEHGPPRRAPTDGSQYGPGRGGPERATPGRGRGYDPGLSVSEHGPRRSSMPPPRTGQGRGGTGPGISASEHGPQRSSIPPPRGGPGRGRGLSASEHGPRRSSLPRRGIGMDNSHHSVPRRGIGMDNSGHGSGRYPPAAGNSLSSASDPGPRRVANLPPAPGARPRRMPKGQADRGPPPGRAPGGRGGGYGNHADGMTQIPRQTPPKHPPRSQRPVLRQTPPKHPPRSQQQQAPRQTPPKHPPRAQQPVLRQTPTKHPPRSQQQQAPRQTPPKHPPMSQQQVPRQVPIKHAPLNPDSKRGSSKRNPTSMRGSTHQNNTPQTNSSLDDSPNMPRRTLSVQNFNPGPKGEKKKKMLGMKNSGKKKKAETDLTTIKSQTVKKHKPGRQKNKKNQTNNDSKAAVANNNDKNNKKKAADLEEAPSTISSLEESSISNCSSISEESDFDDDDITNDEDICFEAEEHPGTKVFLKKIRASLKKFGPVAYSPKVYRRIKKQLADRRFFICDDDDRPYEWREVSKSELIDLVWKYYEEEKGKL